MCCVRLGRDSQLLLLLLFALVNQGLGDCQITRDEFDNTRGVLTTFSNGNYELLRTPSIASNQKLFIFMKRNIIVETTCQNNGKFSELLPIYEPPIAKKVVGNDCPVGFLYSVGYNIKDKFLEVYKSCYDQANARALYSIAKIYPKIKSIDDEQCASRPPCSFTRDDIMTPAEERKYDGTEIKQTFKRIYETDKGGNAKYVPTISRGHLTPVCDFLTYDQACATFKYMNVVPQFQSINGGNWKTIENWVRRVAGTQRDFIYVQTGGIDVLELKNQQDNLKPAYLNGNKIPVPKWTYKLISNSANIPMHAILTYNNVYGEKPVQPSFCKEVGPPDGLSLRNRIESGFTFFCEAATFQVPELRVNSPPIKKPRTG